MVGCVRAVVVAAVMVSVVAAGACSRSEKPETKTLATVDRSARLEELVADSGLEEPGEIEVPGPEGTDARDWLEGEGSSAVLLVAITEELWVMGEEECADTVDALDGVGTPEELLAAAAGTPDAPTQEILVNLHQSTGATLAACGDKERFDDAVAELAWNWALADDRLEELGVTR